MTREILRDHIKKQFGDESDVDADLLQDLETIACLYHESILEDITKSSVGKLRNHGNYTLGVLLTAVEASLGDTKQAEALKAIVRREMFALMDRNQGDLYVTAEMQRPGLTPAEIHVEGQDEVR